MATAEETARLLANTEVFAGLEQRELEEVAQVAVPRRWDRGEILFREGDTGDTCYLVRDGAVLLTREHQDGRLVALAEFRAGDLFGELAMFRGETALGHGRGDRGHHGGGAAGRRHAAAHSPQPRPRAQAARRPRRAREHHHRAAAEAVLPDGGRSRGEHAARPDRGAPGRGRIRPRRARSAPRRPRSPSCPGTSRESASRFLATLERAGLVTLGRGKVTVHEPGRLRNYIH